MSGYTSSSYRTALVAAFSGDREGVQSLLDMPLPEDVTQPMKKTFCNVSLRESGARESDVVRICAAAGLCQTQTPSNPRCTSPRSKAIWVSTQRRVNSSE